MPSFENCEHKLSVFFFNQTSNDIYSLNLTICFQTQNSEYKNPSPLRPGHTVDTVAQRSALWRLAAVYTQWPPVYRVLDPAGTSTCTSVPGSPSPPTQTYPRTETRRCTPSPGKQRQCRPLLSVIKLHSWFSEALDVGFDDHVAADDPVGEVIVDGGMGRQWWEVGFKAVGCVIESLVQLCLDNLSDNSLRYNIFFQPVEYILLIFIEIHF